MELYIYNTDLTPLGVIDEISSFVWTRRYWSVGEFQLLVPFTPVNGKLLQKGNLLVRRGDMEAAQIQYIHISKNTEGMDEIEVQGSFLAGWMDKRILLNQVIKTDTIQNLIYQIVTDNLTAPADAGRKFPLLSTPEEPEDTGTPEVDYVSEPFISALIAVEALAKAAQVGFVIETDIKQQMHTFRVYKGRDLTANQTVSRPCIFSTDFDNILEQEYENSTENLKTVCYVGGEEKEGETRQFVTVGESEGLDRTEIFINATDISRTYEENEIEVTIPLEQYRQLLFERGMKEMEQYAETLNFSSKINPRGNLTYRKDFDLGDRVTCINKRWGIRIDVRITEISETYQQGETNIEVTFGESLPTLFDKINKMR